MICEEMNMNKSAYSAVTIAAIAAALTAGGCNPKVSLQGGDKPIHIVMDINVRVQNELEDFYSFRNKVDAASATTQPQVPATTTTPSQNQ